MVKRLMAKTGTYQKDGEMKNRYTEIGVIMSNDNGEYALFDPSVNLAGVLLQQQSLARETNGRVGDRVMVSIFDNDRNGGQQRQPQQNQGGYGNQQGQQGGSRDLDDSIPF